MDATAPLLPDVDLAYDEVLNLHELIEEWLGKLPPAVGPQEREMLSGCIYTQHNSRLTSQIQLTQGLDGLTITIPDSQT